MVVPYVFSTGLFLRTNYLLDDRLEPVSGVGPNGPSVLGSSIGGIRTNGQALAGKSVIGTELVGLAEGGANEVVRIDSVDRGHGDDQDLLYYRVSRRGGGAWQPLCGEDQAIALPGAWDLRSGARGRGGWRDEPGFFFACRGSTVAKCYELGFKPWKFERRENTILNLHEACVRAIRADYRGTGEAWTREGIQMVLSTDREAQLAAGYQLEAAWSVDGALCRVAERVPGLDASFDEVPACSSALLESEESLLYSFIAPRGSDFSGAQVDVIPPGDTPKPNHQPLIAKAGRSTTVGPVTFTLFGMPAGNYTRHNSKSWVNSTSVHDSGAGAAVGVRITGLPAGTYDVWSIHNEYGVPGNMQVEFRRHGGKRKVLMNDFSPSPSPRRYVITSDGFSDYDLIFREDDGHNRTRLNGFGLTRIDP